MKKFWIYILIATPWIALIDFLFAFRDFSAWLEAWGLFIFYIFMAVFFGFLIYIKKWSLNKILITLMFITVILEIGGGNIYYPYLFNFTRSHLFLGSLMFIIWFCFSLGVYMIEVFVPYIAIVTWEKMRK